MKFTVETSAVIEKKSPKRHHSTSKATEKSNKFLAVHIFILSGSSKISGELSKLGKGAGNRRDVEGRGCGLAVFAISQISKKPPSCVELKLLTW